MTESPNILIVYYSATGNIAQMAHSLAEGAESAGASVRVRRVAETAPAAAIASNPKWQGFMDSCTDEFAELSDIEWCDGIALGSPTRFGNSASQLRSFLDTTGGLWAQGTLARLVGTSFTSASTQHGGLESTILSMNNIFYHWGSMIMPLGYLNSFVQKESGNPYGASLYASRENTSADTHLQAARLQGERLTVVTRAIMTTING
jgi:NAD(P)H dehydrogenase (quinone)